MSDLYDSLYVQLSGDNRRRKAPARKSFVSKIVWLLIIGLTLLSALGRVYLDRQTTKMALEWQKKHEQISVLKKEAENLRMEQEKYMSGEYILRNARILGLRPSEPGQVRLMQYKAGTRAKEESIVASNQY